MKRLCQAGNTLAVLCCMAQALMVPERAAAQTSTPPLPDQHIKTLVVIFDGLRPDYITPEHMPNLYAFSRRGSYGANHHSVFPTVTRVNAAAYATGCYPDKNGLLGNAVYFPSIDQTHPLSTASARALDRIDSATGGHLLTAVSLGEALQSAGYRMMVFSDGTEGQALFQNHKINGAVINTDIIRPDAVKQTVIRELGAAPPEDELNISRHKWITDAFLKFGLAEDGPLVSSIWYTDPDATAHENGVGAPLTMKALKIVDAEFGRILDTLKARRLEDLFNIIVTADHGYVTQGVEHGDLESFLIDQGFKKNKASDDVIVAERALYVKDHDAVTIKKIVRALQAQDWVGAIFTKPISPGAMKGWVEGTLSFESIHWNHPTRGGDILVTENWDDRKNAYGYSGTNYLKGVPGWHGGSSPYEIHIALLAAGPSFRQAFRSGLPTSNIDIVPTILYLHHIPVPEHMDGRVLYELLRKKGSLANAKAKKESISTHTLYDGGTYSITLQRTVLGKSVYVDQVKADRDKK